MAKYADTISEQLAVEDAEPGTNAFVSRFPPQKMVNVANIGYGGCTIGVAIAAACKSVSSNYHLYTAVGNYLGPVFTDRKLIATVRKVRDMRTFATREIVISQAQDDKQKSPRPCLIALLDFQTRETAALLTYSAPPMTSYIDVDSLPTREQTNRELVSSGRISRDLAEERERDSALMHRFFDIRLPPEGVMSQNFGGTIQTSTTQDHIPITKRTSGEYYKAKDSLEQYGDHLVALGFIMDASLAFVPLAHGSLLMESASACSSLDFALRVFTNNLDLSDWHLRELYTVAAGHGRTYSESKLWDKDGNLVAGMTQQSILRPSPQTVPPPLGQKL